MKRLLQLAFSLVAALLLMQQASATPITVTEMRFSNPTTVHIQSTSPYMSEYVYAGAFATTDGFSSFDSWCVDIFKNTYIGQLVNDYTLTSAALALGQPIVDKLTRLATKALALVIDSTTSGAFQLAIWEIVNETSSNPYNMVSGNFKAWGASDASITLAQTWLNNLPVTSAYSMNVLVSPTHQNLAVFTPKAVPEPGTITLLGLGLFGFAMSRRRKL